ncbi:Acetyl esterase [Pigmentiphaga humi]|uniref:Acetyl esterase n=1 Tax=Pigmentiphaga humi TaxID=2478468 RepID=A0A3P4AWQ3_9BURK|nr:alpha/beta hydrolase fold domain-containing protein [Pigmentiphaga humi]VCU68489.1 Acetyl esterase [Pigmentiphaga humi]
MPHSLDPQLVAAYRRADELQAALGPAPKGIEEARRRAAEARRWWNEGGPAMAAVDECEIPGPFRAIPAVVYRPVAARTPQPVYVYLHGGGFRIGNPHSNDRQMRELAAAWGGVVVSADYAHVPEYVFPRAVEECAAIYRYLAEHGASLGVDGRRIAFGGSSAGASVALGAATHLGKEGAAYLRAGALVVGVYDDDGETGSMREYSGDPMLLSRDSVMATLAAYAPEPWMRADPRMRSVDADMSLLPPLFLASAEIDVLRDSSRALAAKLEAAGHPYRYKEYAGMAHLFFGFSRTVERAAECVGDIAAFLSEHLPLGPAGKAEGEAPPDSPSRG